VGRLHDCPGHAQNTRFPSGKRGLLTPWAVQCGWRRLSTGLGESKDVELKGFTIKRGRETAQMLAPSDERYQAGDVAAFQMA